MVGKTISQYRIIEEVGRGGMGVVYKAHDTKLDRTVALKFLPYHLAASDAEKTRFLQEARAAAALNHPNVCSVIDIQEFEDQQFIVMEYVDGVTLRNKIPLPAIQDALTFAIQIGEALTEAHGKGIIHRDVKTENIMVNARNQIKVMDFGLAKLKGTVKLTRTSSTVGTLAYMAPEQIQGGEIDARSDIFSFGVVLFELLTGKLPFRGEHEAALVYSIVNESPESLLKFIPDAPPHLLQIMDKALEKDPQERYQTVADMVVDLRRLKKQSTTVHRPPYPTARGSVSQSTTEPSSGSQGHTLSPQTGSRRRIVAAGLLAILVIVSVLVYVLISVWKAPEATVMKMTKVTSIGMVGSASISPDGRYIVHSVTRNGKRTLVVRQIATASSVEILEPGIYNIAATTFSNDGDYIYYVFFDALYPRGALFRVPVLGGSSEKILTNIASAVTFSPDGGELAFIRSIPEQGEEVLMIAKSDGGGERILVSRKGEEFFLTMGGGPSWSPNGEWIATGVTTTVGGFHSKLVVYRVQDAARSREVTGHRFNTIGRVQWLHDGAGMVFPAQEHSGVSTQVWYAGFDDDEVRRITNDLNTYGDVSIGLTADNRSLMTLQQESRGSIWVVGGDGKTGAKEISRGRSAQEGYQGICWTQDGSRILYSSIAGGNSDIWVMDRDGSNERRLTTDPHGDFRPSIVMNGKAVVFVSDRSGTSNVWIMDIDGSDPRRLTTTEDYQTTPFRNGDVVVYSGYGAGYQAVWKVPAVGGTPIQLTRKPSYAPSVSPDGRLVACIYTESPLALPRFALIPMEGGEPVKTLAMPVTTTIPSIKWSPDGRSLLFVNRIDAVDNIWSQPIDGREPRPVTSFPDGEIFAFDVLTDRTIACSRGNTVSDVVLIEGFR